MILFWKVSVSWLNLQRVEIWVRRLFMLRRLKVWFLKYIFGKLLYNYYLVLKLYIIWKSSIEILNQQISYWLKIKNVLNLLTWMYLSLVKLVWLLLKLEHQLMLAHKFGWKGLIVVKVIFGLLDVCYTNWQHWNRLLWLQICKV
jgi:hypothetical protein